MKPLKAVPSAVRPRQRRTSLQPARFVLASRPLGPARESPAKGGTRRPNGAQAGPPTPSQTPGGVDKGSDLPLGAECRKSIIDRYLTAVPRDTDAWLDELDALAKQVRGDGLDRRLIRIALEVVLAAVEEQEQRRSADDRW